MLRRWAALPSPRRWVVLAGLAVVLAAGVTIFVLWRGHSDAGVDAASESPPRISAKEATQLAAQLGDQNPAVVADVLAEQLRPTYEASPAPLVPAGSTLTIDAETFKAGSAPGYGTVQATASGPQDGDFVVFLVREDGAWHVLGTVVKP